MDCIPSIVRIWSIRAPRCPHPMSRLSCSTFQGTCTPACRVWPPSRSGCARLRVRSQSMPPIRPPESLRFPSSGLCTLWSWSGGMRLPKLVGPRLPSPGSPKAASCVETGRPGSTEAAPCTHSLRTRMCGAEGRPMGCPSCLRCHVPSGSVCFACAAP